MAKPPTNVNIVLEDMPADQRSWLGKLIEPLNRFTSTVNAALDKGLSNENFNQQIKEITFTNNAASFPLKFKSTIAGRPTGLIKVNIVDVSTIPAAITAAVDVVWSLKQNGEIQISNVIGLTANHKYTLTVLLF